MPVLLLARGDLEARNALRRAIEARYGTRPPVLENLHIDFTGRGQFKIGPVRTWIPIGISAYFRFPDAVRWEVTAKPLGLPLQRIIEACDGGTCYSLRGGSIKEITDPQQKQSVRSRAWSVASILLTPLSDTSVTLSSTGDFSFLAAHNNMDDAAEVFLGQNDTIDYVQLKCQNPETDKIQTYSVQMTSDLVHVDGLLLPARLNVFWDNEPAIEIEPVHVESNPTLPDGFFQIKEP